MKLCFYKCSAMAIVLIVSATCLATVNSEDLAWFPQEIQNSSPEDVIRFDIAEGVEYGYVYCENLRGVKTDLHVIKIDKQVAKVYPYFNELAISSNTGSKQSTTSAAAASKEALFAMNGGQQSPSGTVTPFYGVRLNGENIPTVAGFDIGFAYSNDGTQYGVVAKSEAQKWDNYISGEGLLSGGKPVIEARDQDWFVNGRAQRSFMGMADNRYVYFFMGGGRNKGYYEPAGLSYYDMEVISGWFGCQYATANDGGGSSTMVVRSDAVQSGTTLPKDAHTSSSSNKYTILNNTGDGTERKVIDHFLFLDKGTPYKSINIRIKKQRD